MATIYTIGHSTRLLDEFVAAIRAQDIHTLVDIRSFPMSRRLPHFNRESLEAQLGKHGIAYVWLKELGGRRKRVLNDSPNAGLRNESFRNYADYMLTVAFAQAIARLLQIAVGTADPFDPIKAGSGTRASNTPAITSEENSGNTAIMCAERVYFQCHRRLVSDYLTAHGHTVLHIDDDKHRPSVHTLMAEARLVNECLVYDAQ
jgi:uncharacterized protein (DUF488 family)